MFIPKFRRKVIYNKLRADIQKYIQDLCKWKGIEIPPKMSISYFMGYLKGKSSLMVFEKHTNLKYKFGNRNFWATGYYVSTAGLNEVKTRKNFNI